MMKVVYTSGR